MAKLSRILSVLLSLVILVGPGLSGEVLRNDDIVKLAGAGLSSATIEEKIRTSTVSFDTSSDELVRLAARGVPDSVIRAMLVRQSQSRIESEQPRPSVSSNPTSTGRRAPRIAKGKRFEVLLHRSTYQKCPGELKVDGAAISGTGCRDLDFKIAWKDVRALCFQYGANGTVLISTDGGERRISTRLPIEAKAIREAMLSAFPAVRDLPACR